MNDDWFKFTCFFWWVPCWCSCLENLIVWPNDQINVFHSERNYHYDTNYILHICYVKKKGTLTWSMITVHSDPTLSYAWHNLWYKTSHPLNTFWNWSDQVIGAPREQCSYQKQGLGDNAEGPSENTKGSGKRSLQGIHSKNNASYNVARNDMFFLFLWNVF